MSNLIERGLAQIEKYEKVKSELSHILESLKVSEKKMEEIKYEQGLIEKAQLALQQARPLMSQSSIKQCENLANAALSTIFEFPYSIEYSVEDGGFVLNKGDYYTDISESEGGGLVAVISFVFSVYLLIKLGKRRFLAFDEHFTQLSDVYLSNFIEFVRQLCKDLDFDTLLVTHDSRITLDQVDGAYLIHDGKSTKQK